MQYKSLFGKDTRRTKIEILFDTQEILKTLRTYDCKSNKKCVDGKAQRQ